MSTKLYAVASEKIDDFKKKGYTHYGFASDPEDITKNTIKITFFWGNDINTGEYLPNHSENLKYENSRIRDSIIAELNEKFTLSKYIPFTEEEVEKRKRKSLIQKLQNYKDGGYISYTTLSDIKEYPDGSLYMGVGFYKNNKDYIYRKFDLYRIGNSDNEVQENLVKQVNIIIEKLDPLFERQNSINSDIIEYPGRISVEIEKAPSLKSPEGKKRT